MKLAHIPQYTTQDRNVHISVLRGVLWDIRQVHRGIWKIFLLSHQHIQLLSEKSMKSEIWYELKDTAIGLGLWVKIINKMDLCRSM